MARAYIFLTEDSDDCTCSARSISLKLNDGTVIIKDNYKNGEIRKTDLGEERPAYFELTKDELQMLSTNPIARFKITLPYCSDHPMLDERMEEKFGGEIKEAATCIIEVLQ